MERQEVMMTATEKDALIPVEEAPARSIVVGYTQTAHHDHAPRHSKGRMAAFSSNNSLAPIVQFDVESSDDDDRDSQEEGQNDAKVDQRQHQQHSDRCNADNITSSPSATTPSNTTTTTTTTTTGTGHWWWEWLVLFVMLPSFFVQASQRSTIPVIPEFVRTSLRGTDTQIGAVVASVGAGKLLGNLPAGQFVGAHGSYGGLLLCFAVLSLAWAVAATSASVAVLTASCLLEGVGLALLQLSRQNMVTLEVGVDIRGKVQAYTGGVVRVSSIFGPAAGGYLAHHLGLRAPFWAKSSVMVVCGTFLFLYLHLFPSRLDQLHERAEDDNGQDSKGSEKREIPRSTAKSWWASHPLTCFCKSLSLIVSKYRRMFQRISFFVLFMPIARETRLILFPLKAMELGYGPSAIGLMTSISFIVDSCMFPIAGHLMDRHGRKFAGVPSALVLAASYAMAPFATDIVSLTIYSALGGMGNGLSCGIMNAIGSDLAPNNKRKQQQQQQQRQQQHAGDSNSNRRQRAMFLALYRTIADAGIFLGPLVGGTISEVLSLAAAFYVIACTTVVAALWLALVMPETRWLAATAASDNSS